MISRVWIRRYSWRPYHSTVVSRQCSCFSHTQLGREASKEPRQIAPPSSDFALAPKTKDPNDSARICHLAVAGPTVEQRELKKGRCCADDTGISGKSIRREDFLQIPKVCSGPGYLYPCVFYPECFCVTVLLVASSQSQSGPHRGLALAPVYCCVHLIPDTISASSFLYLPEIST